MRVVLRSVVILATFCLASVINPGYFAGCVSDEHTALQFGEAEMIELMDEANAASPFEIAQPGADYRLELSLSQQAGADRDDTVSALFGSRAYACGNRSFRQSASACVTTSEVLLEARYSLFRLSAAGEQTELVHDRELTGSLVVSGNRLSNGEIHLIDAEGTRVELLSDDGMQFVLVRFVTRVDGQSLIF